jgi:hypothetical protein
LNAPLLECSQDFPTNALTVHRFGRQPERPAEHLHGKEAFRLDTSPAHHALRRPSAARLRTTMRRELGSPIVASFSSWVMVRDTVSIVSPR